MKPNSAGWFVTTKRIIADIFELLKYFTNFLTFYRYYGELFTKHLTFLSQNCLEIPRDLISKKWNKSLLNLIHLTSFQQHQSVAIKIEYKANYFQCLLCHILMANWMYWRRSVKSFKDCVDKVHNLGLWRCEYWKYHCIHRVKINTQ